MEVIVTTWETADDLITELIAAQSEHRTVLQYITEAVTYESGDPSATTGLSFYFKDGNGNPITFPIEVTCVQRFAPKPNYTQGT